MSTNVQSLSLLIRKDNVDIPCAFAFFQSEAIENASYLILVFKILCYWYPILLMTNLLLRNVLKIRSRNEKNHSLNECLLSTHLWLGASHPIQVSVSHLGLTNSLLADLSVFILAPSAISSLQQPEWSFKNLSVSSLTLLSTFQMLPSVRAMKFKVLARPCMLWPLAILLTSFLSPPFCFSHTGHCCFWDIQASFWLRTFALVPPWAQNALPLGLCLAPSLHADLCAPVASSEGLLCLLSLKWPRWSLSLSFSLSHLTEFFFLLLPTTAY